MSGALWALVLLPPAAGAVLVCAGRRADRAAPWAGTAVAAVCLVLACAVAVGRPAVRAPLLASMPLRLAVDGLSAVLVVAVAAVTLAVLASSAAGFADGEFPERGQRARFFGLMLLFAGAMLVTVVAAEVAVLLMAWEVMGAASWALIGFWWRDAGRVRAADTAFLTTRAADLGLYLAAGAAVAAGTTRLAALPAAAEPWRSVAAAGVVAAALGKSAQLPFSFWLAGAMRGPSPVSALLHSATMVVAGAYLLLRLGPLLDASGWGSAAVAWAGAVTAVALGLVAAAQDDLKLLLAASSCAQIGFLVLAAGAGAAARTGAVVQLLAHAAAKSLAFLVAGGWLAASGTRSLRGLRGAARRRPALGAAFTVAAVALAGLPPAAPWAGKELLLGVVLRRVGPGCYAVAVAGAVLSAVYCAKALWYVWAPAAPAGGDGAGPAGSPRCGAAEGSAPGSAARTGAGGAPRRVPVLLPAAARTVLAAACVGLAVLAFPPLRGWTGAVVGAAGAPAPHAWEFALSGVLAAGAGAAAWAATGRRAGGRFRRGRLRTRRGPGGGRGGLGGDGPDAPTQRPGHAAAGRSAGREAGRLGSWLGLEGAVRAVLVRPVLHTAALLAAFDDRVLDRAVDGTARGVLRLARFADRPVEAAVDGAVGGVAAAVRGFGRLARRPQTGRLHQYLAQAVGGFALLAAVLALLSRTAWWR